MTRTITVVYEGGVFRPLAPLELPEGTQIALELPPREEPENSDVLDRLFGCLTPEEARKWNADIQEAFGEVEPDAWR